ncbi:MAG: DinB family protein [Candidatus Dormibacteraceae bacterium]
MAVRPVSGERDAPTAFLDQQRQAVRYAAHGLTDDQARARPTASSLTLGGLVKHLTYGERVWTDRILERSRPEDEQMETYAASLTMGLEEALAKLLDDYATVAAETDAMTASIDDLSRAVPLPEAPWFPQGIDVRHVLFHLVEETARHAGHADLLREALDGGLSGPLMAAAERWPDNGFVKPRRPPA